VAGVFALPGFTEFSPVSDGNRDKAIASWQVVLFVLGNCATTEEAEAALLSGDVVVVDTEFPFTPASKGQLSLHLRVGDPSGKTIICECHASNEPPTIIESPGGCVTNLPRFRASLYARDSYADKTGAEAVWTAWHVMNNFDLPRGILRNVTDKGVDSTEYTLWTSVANEPEVLLPRAREPRDLRVGSQRSGPDRRGRPDR